MSKRLSPEDWIKAGFRALAERGPDALKAEPLARNLGSTKGSFYWHFKDLPDFHQAMLSLWRARAATDIINDLAAIPRPQDRLRALGQAAASPAPDAFGGPRVEPAIRAWALANPKVAQAVSDTDALRIGYLKDLLIECGAPPEDAWLIYATYLGLDQLAANGTPAENIMATLIDIILARAA